jgi:gliding motility-associated-like protein
MKKRFLLVFISALLLSHDPSLVAQLSLTSQTTNQYVANLVGPGITYSNVVFNGDVNAIRAFSNGNTTNLGLTSGVVMSTGLLNGTGTQSLSGPSSNFLSGNNGGGSYPELNSIAGSSTYDGLILEFDFVPVSNQLNVEYVFGSEEYNEYVNAGYNDAFAFFISGPGIVGQQNIALVPNMSLPVTIDNINNGNWWGCAFGPCFNCAFYIDNCTGTTLAMDGFTTVLTASRTVIPCSTYHIKLMIADGGDAAFDSWVFLKQDGFYAAGATGTTVTTTTLIPGGIAYEGCGNNQNYFTFTLPAPAATNTTINFTIGGTATNGVDYQAITNSITIPAGQTSANLYINAIADGISEANETVTITVPVNACSTQTFTMTIADPVPLSVSVPPNLTFCAGSPTALSITATPSGGLGTITYSWNNGAGTGQTVNVSPATTTTYTVTATDACGTTATAQTTVTVNPVPTSTFNLPSTGCVGQPVTITYTGNAPASATYNWNFGGGTVQSGSGQGPYTVTFPSSGTFTVTLTVTHNGCTSAPTSQSITINNGYTSTFTAPANLCAGETATITYTGNAPAGATYNWNFGSGTVISGSGQGPYQVQFNTPGVVNVTLSVSSGNCSSSTTTVPITVNQIPTSTFTATSPVCVGQSSTITYTGNGGMASVYNWNFGGGTANPGWGMGPHQVTWNAPGTYTITLTTNLNGCVSPPTSVTVNVISAPTSTFSISPSPPCAGQNVTITYTGNAAPSATYSWNFGGGVLVSGSGQGPYVVNFPNAQNYTVSLQVNQNGCISSTTSQSVAVSQPPTSTFTTSSPVCLGQNVTVTYTGNAPAGATYNWNFGSGTVVSGSGQGPYQVNFNTTGTFPITLTVNNNGCQSNTTTQNVTINPGPSANFTVNPTSLCVGQTATVTYTGGAPANATYNWNFGGAIVQNGSGQGPYTLLFNTANTYNITLTVTQSGCQSTPVTIPVTVNPIPTANFSLPNNACEGVPVTISYTGNAGPGATYNWNFGPGTVVSGSGQGPYQVSFPFGIQNVSLQVSQNGCNSSTVTQPISVNAAPSSAFTVSSPICLGQNATVTYTGGAPANVSYNWNFGSGTVVSGSGQGPYQISFPGTGSYPISLTVISSQCTSQVTTQTVTVNATPTASFTLNPSTVCAGNPVTITYTGSAGAGATYSWNFGGGTVVSGSGSGPYQVQWSGSGTMTVSLTVTENGCSSSPVSQNVLVNANPTATFTLPPSVCQGQSATITYTGNAGAGATYNWNFGGGSVLSGSGQGPYQVQWNTSGSPSVSLSVTQNGCSSGTVTQTLQVNPMPVASFTASGPVCIGDNATISFTGSAPAGSTYNWNFGGGTVASGSGPGPYQVNWNTAGNMTVTLTVSANGCTAGPVSQTVTVNSVPTSTFTATSGICPGQNSTITYTGNAGVGATYNWNFNGGTVASGSGAGPYQVNWPSPGTYTVTLTVTENGCTSTATSQQVQVSALPSAAFSINPNTACVGQPLTVTYTGGAPANAIYNWNFGGATVQSGTGSGPYTITYTNANTYSVTLQVNVGGCISQPYSQQVTINPIPTSAFNIPFTGCAMTPVNISYTGNAGPGATYNWNFDGGTVISGTGQGPYSVQWTQQGIYNVSLQVTQNGCTSSVTTQPISINANPIASFSVSPSPACVGQPVTVSYTGNMPPNVSYTYNFPGGTILSGSGQGPFQVSWSNAGTYDLSLYVIAGGCTSQVFTLPLTVNNPPTSTFTVAPTAVCEGQTATITYTGTAGAGASFNWNFGGGTVVGGSGQGPYQVSWSSAGSPSISLTVMENGCLSSPTTLPVTVYPIPTAAFSATSPLCPGQNGTISYTGTASPAATYAWNFGSANVVSGSGQGPYQVNWSASGTYNVTLTVTENGCQSTPVTQNILVHATPSSAFTLPAAACEGETVTISYAGNSGQQATYTWNFGGGTVISGTGQGPYQVEWNSAGNPTVTLTVNENGCQSSPTSQTITIHPIPTATFSATGPVCPGENSTVTYTGTAGPQAMYSWNFGGGNVVSGSGQGPYQVNWITSGQQTLTLTVTENGCQSPVFSQNVTVHPTPSAQFSVTPAVCENQAASISYTGSASANATYNWNFGGGNVMSGNGPGPYQVSWSNSGIMTVTLQVIENNCPSSVEQQTLTVHPIPTATFTAPNQLCEGEVGVLSYTGTGGNGALFTWNFGGGVQIPNSPDTQPQVSWNTPGTVTVTLTVTENNCVSLPHGETITINAHPTATFTLTSQVCDGASASVVYTGNADPQNATFNWNFGGGTIVSGSGAGPYEITWSSPGTYSVTLDVTESGCTSSPESHSVVVYAIPSADFSVVSPICEGGSSTFTYTGTASNNATFTWNFDGGTLISGSGAGPVSVTWNNAGTYSPSLTVTENGCTSQPFATVVTVNALPSSSFTLTPNICAGGVATATYTGSAGAGAQFNWQISGGGSIQAGSGIGPLDITWTNDGTYTVDLTVTENGCSSPPSSQTVTVHPIPTATFTAPSAVCVGQPANFTYAGTAGTGASYSWNFAGGQVNSGSGAGPYQVLWNTSGTVTVSLTVTENNCTSSPFSADVVVNPIPTSTFTVGNACSGQTSAVTYTGSASPSATYQWNFGLGSVQSGSGQGPFTILWPVSGNTQVSLTVTENGCTSPLTQLPVTIYSTPTASFTSNTAFCEGGVSTISFNGTAGPSATYSWNFGNGVIQSGSGAGPYQVVFQNAGQQQVSLVVTENGCSSAPYQQAITVYPTPSVSIVPPQPQCVGSNNFSFSTQGNYGNTATFQWTFTGGNPASSSQAQPQNISWSVPGSYLIQVIVTENGCSGSADEQVVIYPDPIPSFTATPLSGCVPLSVQFTNTTQAQGPLTVTWNFGNGQNGSGLIASTVYSDPGNYSVSIQVTDAYGCTVNTTLPGLIQAHALPIAGFSAAPMIMTIDEPFIVVTDNSQLATQWYYTFGDGGYSFLKNPTHNYQDVGQYTITQIVSNAFGCSDTATLEVVVNPVSEVFVPNTFTPNGDGVNDIWLPILSYVRQADIWVFDRWGQVVFYSNDVYTGWNGTYKNSGGPVKQDTYVYLIEYKNYAGKTQTLRGSLTLVR